MAAENKIRGTTEAQLIQPDLQDVEVELQDVFDVKMDGEQGVSAWGSILGDIRKQKDLMELVDSNTDTESIPLEYIENLQ